MNARSTAPIPEAAHDELRGVYVHVPWCRRRCPYCDFYFEIGKAEPGFAQGLAREITARRGELAAGPAHTLYLGGGTPSALPAEELAAVIDVVREGIGLADDGEITVEANPEDVDDAFVRALADSRVDRVSLGVQSFDDRALRALGRAHDGAAATRALHAVREVARASVDIIAGVPGDELDRACRDVDYALAGGAGHISHYLLTVEPGTPLAKQIDAGRRARVDDDMQADAYERVQAHIAACGLRQYEISSFARPGEESRHNRIYWSQGVYLGLGPGAHSLRRRDDGGVIRRHTHARLREWMRAPHDAAAEIEELAPEAALREALAFGLRDLLHGVVPSALAARHRCALPVDIEPSFDDLAARGLLDRDRARVLLTAEGARFADLVARTLLSA